MPRVHAQLRRVTDIDPVFIQPEDIIEPEPDENENENAGRRARKRRRIETIANQYLKLGRVPLIVSAGLRGPFSNGWKNPWVKAPSQTTKEAVQSEAKVTAAQEDQTANPARARTRRAKSDNPPPASSVPSPEASRAPDIAQDSVLPSVDLPDEDYSPPDASTAQHDDSGATESFSADLGPSVTFDNSGGNPFWLKRPQLKSAAFRDSVNGGHDPSPTRARLGHRPVDRNGRLLLVTPRQPVSMLQSDPGANPSPEPDWMSAASASMIGTSPAKPTNIIQENTSSVPSTRRKRTYSKFERNNTRGDQSANGAAGDISPPEQITRRNTSRDPSQHSGDAEDRRAPTDNENTAYNTSGFTPINRPSRSAKPSQFKEKELYALQGQKIVAQQMFLSAPNTETRNPNKDIQNSAEPHLATSPSRSARTAQTKKNVEGATPSLRHDHITSPTLAASIGFIYRKVGEAKRMKTNNKQKGRPITFSFPAIINQPPVEIAEHETEPVNEATEHESVATADSRTERPDIWDVPGSPPQREQQSYKSSRTPGLSTQAAFMMAQMEFQDGTMPTVAEDAPTPWPPSTANEDPIVPSPAFTPFHKFNATLEEHYASESTMPDMPISTQDLFATISPFANSTVKKSTRVPATNLKFSVFENRKQDSPSHNGRRYRTRSPASPQRKPLQEKNSRVSLLGSQSDKGSQGDRASQESVTPRPSKAPVVQSTGLPQLEFCTSNGDLDFTDRFLINMNETT
ncbi:hypothetical protein PMIN06_001638 [Paraphaeosphaeria minitans]|uniref:Uncharacterized protein n=1 Tax=Paraphaeosphaeria minitans TaxID=565426 RepID=A0A9P6KVN0_9PLEO|nr:hypothetical protein PMIN01_00054 [Paraphaeosphaeria minitans]